MKPRRRPPRKKVPDRPAPVDPIEPPDIDLPGVPTGPVLVDRLDEGLPLVLFPVRLATRFHRGDGPGKRPTDLWVRIFPDALHADSHLTTLTREEAALGRAYWGRLRGASGDEARQDAHRWLVSQLGAPRAAWVAARTESVPPPSGGAAEPRATLARLLPDRWYVRIANGDNVEDVWSQPVRRDLAMAPNVAEIPEGGGIRDLLRSQDLWWMADFQEAVDAGMAVRVPLDAEMARNIGVLIVLGVRDTDPAAPAELAGLLEAHRFTSGLEIVPHGTPTNTTATIDAGYTDVPADLGAYMARQLAEPPADGPPPAGPVALATAPAADALALALGLDGATAFDAAEHAGDRAGGRAAAMNRVMWPATWGHFFSALLATGGTPIVHGDDLDWLRAWFRDWVRGAGPLPLFRAGEQAYGVLPVTVLPDWGFPDTRIGHLQSLLYRLLNDWAYGLSGVAAFSWPVERTPEEEAVAVAAVLGAVPHPTAFRLRRALDRSDLFAGQWQEGLAELERLLAKTPSVLARDEYELELEDPIRNGSIDDQSGSLNRLRELADDMAGNPQYRETAEALAAVRDHVDDVLRPDTARHGVRSETRRLSEGFSDATLPDPADPALWYVEYGGDAAAADGTFPDLELVPGGGPEGDRLQLAASLRGLAADARSVTAADRPAYDHSSPRSLFRVLVEHGIEQVNPAQAEELALGLDRLAEMCEGAAVDDPVAELARLMRETLGLATHRLDAWITSVATPPAGRAARHTAHGPPDRRLRLARRADARHPRA